MELVMSCIAGMAVAFMNNRMCDPLSCWRFYLFKQGVDIQTALLIKREVCDYICRSRL